MSKINNIAAVLNMTVVFQAAYYERFLEKQRSVQALLYLERKIIYLSTIYIKFILLAYSVFLKNEEKRTRPNKWRMKISRFAKPIAMM